MRKVKTAADFRCVVLRSPLLRQLLSMNQSYAHPYPDHISRETVRSTVRAHLALNEALPFIQTRFLQRHASIDHEVYSDWAAAEINRIVSNILDDESTISRELRRSVSWLFGWELKPDFCDVTKRYLLQLHVGLTHYNEMEQLACQMAFILHSEPMTDGLYDSLASLYNLPRYALPSLEIQFTGELQTLINKLTAPTAEGFDIPPQSLKTFAEAFTRYYFRNVSWCLAVASIGD
jgi:hypothetical protein